mmetsp:Transcript_22493/g.35350  ORF Transcript_22493/g.35350 Transcript_22493/m.35350 type:complete len:90 (-) Transcript_22493:884-1153(-)
MPSSKERGGTLEKGKAVGWGLRLTPCQFQLEEELNSSKKQERRSDPSPLKITVERISNKPKSPTELTDIKEGTAALTMATTVPPLIQST